MANTPSASADYTKYAGSPFVRAVRWLHHLVNAVWIFAAYTLIPVFWLCSLLFSWLADLILWPTLQLIQCTPVYPIIVDFGVEHRGWFLAFTMVPLSFAHSQYSRLHNLYSQAFLATPHLHDARVREVQQQVQAWNAAGRGRLMVTARPPWLSVSLRVETYKDTCEKIRIDLPNILEVNTESMTVRCEPMVNMGQITRHLVPMGYALAVMIEMDDLTVGGLLMGVGVEVSSHIHGFFSETVRACEVVLGDGSLVRCSRTENADLFHALPWSHGTLGFLVAVDLKIVPIKPYVHMTYIPCYSQDELQSKLTKLTHASNAPPLIEATIFSKDTAVIFTGEFSDGPPAGHTSGINDVGHIWKPWFYKHVESFLQHGRGEDWIPLRAYFHRHTRSIFWELPEVIPISVNWWYKYVFGWMGPPRIAYLKLSSAPAIREASVFKHVVQDIVVPLSHLKDAIEIYHDAFEVYPLLFYPVRIYKQPDGLQGALREPLHPRTSPETGSQYEMYFNLGVYGVPPKLKRKESWDAVKEVRRVEKFARDRRGYQLLYTDSFMTRTEFEEMFDHQLYRECRRKYNAIGAFPEIYDKVKSKYCPAEMTKE
ncbi:24-dehydrocholesterol reductase [Akanthomyces lecanii RCEF 1005]|uniref:Delta(24)-sterol reductase n=1 Tax=Akanthomyces lecanii RCEF 1005 TaxID=1081108 RepID=A0A162MZF9_CORDF|nr:24-dehydrocholesterol reductase [Akanthomyces lecanii RCEF 1005]